MLPAGRTIGIRDATCKPHEPLSTIVQQPCECRRRNSGVPGRDVGADATRPETARALAVLSAGPPNSPPKMPSRKGLTPMRGLAPRSLSLSPRFAGIRSSMHVHSPSHEGAEQKRRPFRTILTGALSRAAAHWRRSARRARSVAAANPTTPMSAGRQQQLHASGHLLLPCAVLQHPPQPGWQRGILQSSARDSHSRPRGDGSVSATL